MYLFPRFRYTHTFIHIASERTVGGLPIIIVANCPGCESRHEKVRRAGKPGQAPSRTSPYPGRPVEDLRP